MPLIELRCRKCQRLLAEISEECAELLKSSEGKAKIEILCTARGYSPGKYSPELKKSKCNTMNVFPG
jgi:phage FluMu protein Com